MITCTYHKALPRKLPQYLHTLFQLALAQEQVQAQTQSSSKGGPGRGPDSSSSSSSTIAESVVDQVLYLAKKSKPQSQGQGDPYPDAELEWLATMAFNRAVDFYRDSADEECKRWAGKAIEVADLVSGEGGLGGLLRRNLGMLGL